MRYLTSCFATIRSNNRFYATERIFGGRERGTGVMLSCVKIGKCSDTVLKTVIWGDRLVLLEVITRSNV